jgi:gamma-glutamylcysteine synthetase
LSHFKIMCIIVPQGEQSISLEPGGQIELSGAPFKTLHQTYDEINSHLYQVSIYICVTL